MKFFECSSYLAKITWCKVSILPKPLHKLPKFLSDYRSQIYLHHCLLCVFIKMLIILIDGTRWICITIQTIQPFLFKIFSNQIELEENNINFVEINRLYDVCIGVIRIILPTQLKCFFRCSFGKINAILLQFYMSSLSTFTFSFIIGPIPGSNIAALF